VVGIRPEDLTEDPNGVLDVGVSLTEPLGAEVIVHFELDAPPLLADDCTARLNPRTKASRGDLLRLVVDPSSLYFFDPDTETALT
ncbi:MAG TPA: TOBE domain-containing protein, partial [Gaiellaceae bacterium]